MGDMVFIEYKPEIYHLGEMDVIPKPGEVAISKDGKRKYTRDGGVWAVGDREKYRDYEDVVNVNISDFEAEEVSPAMVDEMRKLFDAKAKDGFPVPWHYGTLITRATIEFGWEPFLIASALEPKRFAKILDRFAQASLAVVKGWTQIDSIRLIGIHDDIAGTRGVIMKPDWYREYVFPWYSVMFDAIHEKGKKVLYISDGNYMPVLDDILAANPDGLYIESSSMPPKDFMPRAGKDKLFLIKTNSFNIDFGAPDDIYNELKSLRDLHVDFPGMMIYRGGGNPRHGNAEAFDRYYNELLVYERN